MSGDQKEPAYWRTIISISDIINGHLDSDDDQLVDCLIDFADVDPSVVSQLHSLFARPTPPSFKEVREILTKDLPYLSSAEDLAHLKALAASIPEAGRSASPKPPPTPPQGAELLVGLFCKREMREAVLGDLDEKFAELAERRGPRAANAWYWSQAARSALFFAWRWGRRLLELEAILRRIL